MKVLFNKLLLHLSEESRDTFKNQGIDINHLITEKYKRPLFNYNIEYQLHHISGFGYCFSILESIHCNNVINDNILEELAKICKSIKKLRFDIICQTVTYGIIKLIGAQSSLNDVNFSHLVNLGHLPFIRCLEELLIKHADTIQCLKINRISILRHKTYFVNLLRLEIVFNRFRDVLYVENLLLPILKILKVRLVSSDIMTKIVENTKGHLSEIILFIMIIIMIMELKKLYKQYIQNCPNLKYFKLSYNIELLISELKNLLINCKFLNG
ncbi:hypothetical protein C1646_763940 [Rhizophagus diaphanus]|nr:hypothetical protein C1646_763940 [Rhizophagus diaphanus] [Rhizophagus sp. MUCL 43196]